MPVRNFNHAFNQRLELHNKDAQIGISPLAPAKRITSSRIRALDAMPACISQGSLLFVFPVSFRVFKVVRIEDGPGSFITAFVVVGSLSNLETLRYSRYKL